MTNTYSLKPQAPDAPKGLGDRVQRLGFGIQGSGSRVWGIGFRVWEGSGLRVYRVQSYGFRVRGLGMGSCAEFRV